MNKKILFGQYGREKLIIGIDTLATAVKATLGPKGRNVVFERSFGSPLITKDGVTVAKEIKLKDPVENMGAQMIKEVACKTAEVAGDGTTTATILAQAIFAEGYKLISAGANPMALKAGIDKATQCIINELKSVSKTISDSKEIEQIATISANSDTFIGSQIARAMDTVGRDGVITVEEAKGIESELVLVEGMQFDRGYLSPYFITDQDKSETILENALILLCDFSISNMKNILSLLDKVLRTGKSLLIIAEDVDGDALSTLVVNKMRGVIKVAAVKAPAFGERKSAMLEDMAILTGGLVINDTSDITLDTIDIEQLGSAKRIIITKDSTTIIEGNGNKELIEQRIAIIKSQIAHSTSDFDKDRMKERISKLSNGVAIIKVGAATEIEMREIKDRIDDALSATKAAIDEGIVIGGGCALLHAQSVLKDLILDGDEALGVNVLYKAIEAPYRCIAMNAGIEPSVWYQHIVSSESNIGLDAKDLKICNLMEAGIIDPVKVTRCALQNASSIAGLLLTTEAVISIIPEPKSDNKNNMMPPMM